MRRSAHRSNWPLISVNPSVSLLYKSYGFEPPILKLFRCFLPTDPHAFTFKFMGGWEEVVQILHEVRSDLIASLVMVSLWALAERLTKKKNPDLDICYKCSSPVLC